MTIEGQADMIHFINLHSRPKRVRLLGAITSVVVIITIDQKSGPRLNILKHN